MESLTILLVFQFLLFYVVLVKGILRPDFGIVWHSGISLVVVLGPFAKKSKMVARLKFYLPRDVLYSSESCSGDFFGAFTQATTAVFERNFPGFQLVLFLRTRPGAGRGWLARREVRGQQDGGGWQGKHPFPAVL